MKKTFLTLLMAGSSIAMFAQTTPTTTPTNPTTTPTTTPTTPRDPMNTNPTTTPTTSRDTTPRTTTTPRDPMNTTPTTPTTPRDPMNTNPTTTTTPRDQMNTTPTTTTPTNPTTATDPMNTTTTTDVNSNTNNQVTTSTSNAWAPGTSPYWGWNNYGLWNTNMYPTTNINSNTTMDNGTLNSTSSYSASGTSVATVPYFVQTNFPKDYPVSANQSYSWNQYGEWFQTHHLANGRLIQYYYDSRGRGYSLALPVIQTYVPEDIIVNALQKYGANLYSVSMVNTADGNSYNLGIIERGQLRTEYVKEDGSPIANIWRVEEVMIATDSNAAMESQHNLSTEASTTTDHEMKSADEKETKMKWKENGKKTKIKTGDGKVKIKQKKVDD